MLPLAFTFNTFSRVQVNLLLITKPVIISTFGILNFINLLRTIQRASLTVDFRDEVDEH